VGGGSLLFATEVDGVYLPAPNLETAIHVRVTGMLARTEVRQRFHNPTDAWVEGVYVFPLPERSAVDTLHMVIGDRVIEGEIQEREEAKRTYERARAEGRKASLVEQERPNLFTTSVANLGPDETVEVVIHYQEELRYQGADSGIFSLRLPLVAPPRFVPGGIPGVPGSGRLARTLNGTLNRSLTGVLRQTGLDPAARTLRTVASPVPDAERITAPVAHPASIDPDHPLNPVTLTVDLDAGFPVDRLGSSSHALVVSRRGPSGYRIRAAPGQGLRVAGGPDALDGGRPPVVPADRDFVLEWAPAVGREPGAALFTEEVDGETYALLMVLPPSERRRERPLPRETVFVIDTSGSMHGPSIAQARRALRFALDRLRPEDSFNVIRFADDTESLFPESLPADPRALEMARLFVGDLEAGGGTMMLPAVRRALRGGRHARSAEPVVRQVIFITDGAVGNEAQLFRAIHEDLGETRLFTVGIGSAPNGHFMRRAADFGRGTFTYIGRPEEVAPKMEELFGKIDSPVLTDLEVEWSDPAAETWPERVPDLYRGEPVVVAARLPSVWNGSDATVRVQGSRGSVPWRFERGLDRAEPRPGVAKLWARRKIGALMDQGVAGAPADVVRAEVVDVALRHHLVSKHTSLVAVDRTPTRPADATRRSLKLPVNLPAGWSYEHVVGTLPRTGTPARLLLLLGLLALVTAALLVTAPKLFRPPPPLEAAGFSRPDASAASRTAGFSRPAPARSEQGTR
jgi:Ca-activated chloride channel family protein